MGFPRLVMTAEIAELLGVSRQRVSQLQAKPSFPKPVAVLSGGKIWRESDVLAWAEQRDTRRQPGPPSHPRPILYTVSEAARVLAISERKMRQLVADGDVASVLIGRRRLVSRDELTAYVARLG